MGFLSDLGRSNAFQVGQTLLDDTMRVGQQERQGILGELQAQDHMQRTAIAQAEEARRQKEELMKMKAMEEEQAFQNRPFNIKSSPLLTVHADSEDYQQRFDQLRQIFGADEMGNTTHGNVLRGTKEIFGNKELMEAWLKPRLDMIEKDILTTQEKLRKANLAGDTDTVKKLGPVLERLNDQYLMKSKEYGKKLMESEKQKDDQKRAEIAQQRADENERWHREQKVQTDRRLDIMEKRAVETGGETKEEKRKVKALTEVRKEVERAYGFSQFLPTAQEPKMLQKVAMGKAIAEDIIENYKNYGYEKEPTPGVAAKRAKEEVEKQMAPKPTAPAEDKKSRSIREILFGSPEKK